jgi:alkanesulfonate monooxygenase
MEVSWFAALCDDDHEFLGVTDAALLSSWEHCRGIALAAEEAGYDNLLLPSGYALGIDSVAFAAAVAPLLRRMRLLLAVRLGEMWVPQLARQLASIDQMLDGRLTVNIISSDLPGQSLDSAPRYRRTLEIMRALRLLLDGQRVDVDGEFLSLHLDPPRVRATGAAPFYFGGLSPAAREVAAQAADVFLLWPDTLPAVAATLDDMRARAAAHGRTLRFGYRAHVIVRETEAQARAAARRLVSRLDPGTGERVRAKSLDTGSAGVAAQVALRDAADDEGLRRGQPVDRHRPRPLRRRGGDRRRPRPGARQAARLPGPGRRERHPVRLPAPHRGRPVRPLRPAAPGPRPAGLLTRPSRWGPGVSGGGGRGSRRSRGRGCRGCGGGCGRSRSTGRPAGPRS